MNSFYSDRSVRHRLIEYLGGDSLEHATAVYITKTDDCAYDPRELRFPAELDWYLDRDLDIARSLADSNYMLMHLDVEYVNFDSPSQAYHDPRRAFELQQPVVHTIESLLLGWGIRPLHIITGQGHHFAWKIRRDSAIAQQITELCPAPELLENCQQRVPSLFRNDITLTMQQAFGGIALLMEYIAHRVKEYAAPRSELPVEITAVHVGCGANGQREIISLDISEYGDPLFARMIRMPFTNYLKPKMTSLAETMGLEGLTPALRAIPLHEMDIYGALDVRLHEEAVKELASRACVRIPEQPQGTAKLLEEYRISRLRHFHQYFYSQQHEPPERWPETYNQTPLDHLPPCVRYILEAPNDKLLKPAGMQLVTRTLLAEEWHPRHIAGYIRSIFENPAHGWGVDWHNYEAGTRADFYVRTFSSLYETGLDRLVDFNCVSTAEKGFCCSPSDAGVCLQPFYDKLLNRQCR